MRLHFLIFVLTCLLGVPEKIHSQNNCLKFDGINDDVAITYNPSLDFSTSQPFTIEAWFNTTASTGMIFSTIYNSSPYKGYELGLYQGQIFFQLVNTFPGNLLRIETPSTFNDGTWHHVAAVYKGIPNGSNVSIYVDGVLQPCVVTDNSLTGNLTTGHVPHIGSRQSNAYFLGVQIDEVKVWGKALCVGEITARKNCGLLGTETSLLAYYNFNSGIAGSNNTGVLTLPDLTGNGNLGALSNFALSGAASNWVSSGAPVSGTCGPVSVGGPVSITGNTLVCSGLQTILTASVIGASSYSWSNGVNTQSVSLSQSTNTTYTVSAFGAGICASTQTVLVSVQAAPVVSLQALGNPLCSGQIASLTAGGASTYTWYPGNLNGSQVSVSPTITTTYTIVGTNINGCKDTALYVQIVEMMPVVFVQGQGTSSCPGQSVNLAANGALTYTWQPGNLVGFFVTVSPTVTTTYTVTGTGGSGGCKGNGIYTQVVMTCDVTGIGENVQGLKLLDIFPNPVATSFMISGLNNSGLIMIYNNTGQLVKIWDIAVNGSEINAGELSKGIYFLIVLKDEQRWVKKIVKE